MNEAEIRTRLAELRAKQEASPGWGAAVGARQEEIKELEGQLLSLTVSLPVTGPEQVWPHGYNSCLHTAISALNYLSSRTRPVGGQDAYNAEHLLQIADEIKRTIAHNVKVYAEPGAAQSPDTRVREALKPFAGLANVWCEKYGTNGEITISVDLADLDHARKALLASGASNADTSTVPICIPKGFKPVYVKRWRTLILVGENIADEVRDALRDPEPQTVRGEK